MRRMTLLVIPILLNGCAANGAVEICAPWRVILVSRDDVLTRPTAEAVLAHNETGARLCGWKGRP